MASFFVTSMLFLFCMRMLVYLHVCAHMCGGQRSASDSISQDAVHLLFGFEIKFLPGTWELLIQPSQQAVKPRRSASLNLRGTTCPTTPPEL